MSASIDIQPDGQVRLSGRLDFASVPQLWPALREQLAHSGQLTLSLAGVQQANSAALALLLELRQTARAHDVAVVIADLPAELRDLARLSGAESLLDG